MTTRTDDEGNSGPATVTDYRDLLDGGGIDAPLRMPSRPSPPVPAPGRPVRKDEIELTDRGLYIESWLPERRSRRKPLLFVHGELTGSWPWGGILRSLPR